MRDLIWTIIVVWFVFKLIDVFRKSSVSKNQFTHSKTKYQPQEDSNPSQPSKKDFKTAVQKRMNKEGEYVDFEELK